MSSHLKGLEQQTQYIISSLLDNQTQAKDTKIMTHNIRCQLATLIQMVRRLDTISPNERLRTRASVIESHRSDRGNEMKDIISMIEMLDIPHAEEIILGKSVTEAINELYRRDNYNIPVSVRETIPKYQVSLRRKVRI